MTSPEDGGTGAGGAEGGPDDVGSVAEEAAKLFGALGDWAKANAGSGAEGVGHLGDALGRAVHDVDEHLATGAAECRYCPLCRLVQAVRDTDPEVKAHLTAAVVSLMHAANGLLATAVPGEAATTAGVEHIDLDDTDDPGDTDSDEWSDEP